MEIAKKNILSVVKNLEVQLNPIGFNHVSEKFDEYGPYHYFVRKDNDFIEVINISFSGTGLYYQIIDIQLEKKVEKITNVINSSESKLYSKMVHSFRVTNNFVEYNLKDFAKVISELNIVKSYTFSNKYDTTDEAVSYLNYAFTDLKKVGLNFFEGMKHIDNFILKINKNGTKKSSVINTDNSAFAWEIRRILLAKDLGDSAFMEQCFKDFEQNLIDWASYTHRNDPDDYVYINYGYEVMKRAKRVIYENVALDDLELIPLEIFPKRLTDSEQIYGRNTVDASKPAINIEEPITQNTSVPVGNIDLMGISIVKGYRADFVDAFINATESGFVLDADDELSLDNAAREFNSHAFYFTSDENEGWTAITIMAEDIADVMPSIRDGLSYLDEVLAELFPNAAIVTLNQYDTVGAYGFAVTEQGKKHRGFLSIEGNEYENYGEPLPEEKEHESLDTAMFYITKRLIGFAFTDKNINKPMLALKQI